MADALCSQVLKKLASLTPIIEKEVTLVRGAHEEAIKLSETLTMLQKILEYAEEMQVEHPEVKQWLADLKDFAYDMDDDLDEWNTRMLALKIEGVVCDFANDDPIKTKVCSVLSTYSTFFRSFLLRYQMARKMKSLRLRLDVIKAKDGYTFVMSSSLNRTRLLTSRPITSSLVDASDIYGRLDDKNTILSKLLSEGSDQNLHVPVISIVGTGGFGKTTLAQLVLDEKQVIDSFKLMWVCVPNPFDLESVARLIIEEAGEEVPSTVGWQALQKRLCNSIQGKRFLLVLDDVWSYDDKYWTPLKLSLRGGAPGSRIMVTTRDENVAKMMGSSYTHRVEHLSEGDCWKLFKGIAFQGRSRDDRKKLQEIGKEIAKNCKGVPLAARILASLMCLKESKEDWMEVLGSDIWEAMSKVDKGFLPELLLSYSALPSHLKQCFMYCAIFQNGGEIKRDELVKLWMAQGFLGSDGSRDLEKLGRDYFDSLANLSFFQDFKRDGKGHIVSCKMHDLVLDFAQFLTESESSILDMNVHESSSSKFRHMSAADLHSPFFYQPTNLRTLRGFNTHWLGTVPIGVFHHLTCLRALDLSGIRLVELPAGVDKLLHLRYLDLSWTRLKELPETTGNLLNLQTLKLNGCAHLSRLPKGIGQLCNLRHLEIDGTIELSYLPREIGRLSHLRTLCKFIVSGEAEGSKIVELKHLNNLQGSLQISGLREVADAKEVEQAQLNLKKNLRSMKFVFIENFEGGIVRQRDAERMKNVLEGLQPHDNLEELYIEGYPGPNFPSWMSRNGSLPNVVTLKLDKCKQCVDLPTLGKLQFLEELSLKDMESVKHIGHKFFGLDTDSGSTGSGGSLKHILFPALKKLLLENMLEWENWEDTFPSNTKVTIMPSLCELSMFGCPKLKVVPHYMFSPALKYLRIAQCPELTGAQPCIPPLLEKLELGGDAGVFSKSLPISGSPDNCYPNLKSFTIHYSALPSLPQGFNQLPAIQALYFTNCKTLNFMPKDLNHLTMLQQFKIYRCPCLKDSCGGTENWVNISQVPKIITD